MIERFLLRIQTFALEAVVGYPPDLSEITSLEYNGLLTWRSREEQIERSRRFATPEEA